MRVYNKHRDKNIPKDAVYVGRPTQFGNPFTVDKYGRGEAVKLYNQWIYEPEQDYLRGIIQRELSGKDLICWCVPAACHASTIMEIANESPGSL